MVFEVIVHMISAAISLVTRPWSAPVPQDAMVATKDDPMPASPQASDGKAIVDLKVLIAAS